jgi:hypothetical protein
MSQTEAHLQSGDTITTDDICSMAGRLIGRHGREALEIAGYFAEENRLLGDDDRAAAWQAVQSLVADIIAGCTLPDRSTVH